MTAGSRLRIIPWALGLVLLVGSAAGAKLLRPGAEPGSPGGADGGPPAARPGKSSTTPVGGLIVLGSVDSEPSPIPLGPPALGLAAVVDKVLVHEGQEVKAGTPLIQFDDAIYRAKLKQAQAELEAAKQDEVRAAAQKSIHAIQVRGQEVALAAAENDAKDAEEALRIGRDQFERVLAADRNLMSGQPLSEIEKQQRRRENLDLRKAELGVSQLRAKAEGERYKLEGLKLSPVDADVKASAEKVKRLAATVEEAQAAINASLRKAEVPGTVEQISAGPGATYGPSSRAPVLWLVPTGTRIVRGEVEAEFAYKLADKIGTKVTITDQNNFGLVYDGVIRRVSGSYLPKRSAAEVVTMQTNKVLECVVEVVDPAPAGKPPLRVGQPVRISIP